MSDPAGSVATGGNSARARRRWHHWAAPLAVLAVFLLLWEAGSRAGMLKPISRPADISIISTKIRTRKAPAA